MLQHVYTINVDSSAVYFSFAMHDIDTTQEGTQALLKKGLMVSIAHAKARMQNFQTTPVDTKTMPTDTQNVAMWPVRTFWPS